jgi:hypothetical protein
METLPMARLATPGKGCVGSSTFCANSPIQIKSIAIESRLFVCGRLSK